jgi:hypothetical protein
MPWPHGSGNNDLFASSPQERPQIPNPERANHFENGGVAVS